MIKIDVDERKWEKIKEEHSEWYSDNILPNIRNAYEFIESQKSKSYSMKKYLELLKKIIDKGKDFIIQKELFLDYENKEIDKIIKIMKKKNKKRRVRLFLLSYFIYKKTSHLGNSFAVTRVFSNVSTLIS